MQQLEVAASRSAAAGEQETQAAMTKLAASCLAIAALIAVAAALVASPLLVWGQHTAPALQWVKQHASQQLGNVQQLAQWPASLLKQQGSCVCPVRSLGCLHLSFRMQCADT